MSSKRKRLERKKAKLAAEVRQESLSDLSQPGEDVIRAEAALLGISLRVTRTGGGVPHWQFRGGSAVLANYWPSSGSFCLSGEKTRKVAGPEQALEKS